MVQSTSAIAETPIEVLFALHDKFDLLDFAGPLEALSLALHDPKDNASKAFGFTFAGPQTQVLSNTGAIINSQISFDEAHKLLGTYDVLVVVGGNSANVLAQDLEPLHLVKAFAELQEAHPTRERTLLAICTSSLFLAKQGILLGLSATTHPSYLTKFESQCSHAATYFLDQRTEVLDDARYVVNNLRFDIGNQEENPYIRRKSDAPSRPKPRKGSMSFKDSNTQEKSISRRAAMRLGGLRVITTGGVSAGVDASLYLVGALVSNESALEVARHLQWNWTKGVVVDGLDV